MHAQRHWKLKLATGLALTGLLATAAGASTPPPADPPSIAGVGAPTQNTDLFNDLLNKLIGHSGDNDSTGDHDGCDTKLDNVGGGGNASSPATPFSVNFFGARTQLFVNNDGTVTFGSAQGAFPGTDLTALTKPTIAPFLADAAAGAYYPETGKVTYGSVRGGRAFCVRWEDMTPQTPSGSLKNTFSLLLRKTNDTGDFDIEFRYDHILWDGGAPGASVGLTAGTPSIANSYFVLPGSRSTTGEFLDTGLKALRSTKPTIQSGSFLFHVVGGIPTPVGHPPTAPNVTASGNEDAVSIPFTLTSTDADNDAVTFAVPTRQSHGTVNCPAPTTTGTNPATTTALCSYIPDSNFNGTDTFNYRASDNHGNTTTGTAAITINPVNDAPKVVNQSVQVHLPNAVTFNVLQGATDVENNTITLNSTSALTQPTYGNLICDPSHNGSCTFTPSGAFPANGSASFTFTATDSQAANAISAPATVTITAKNDPPVASFTTSVPSQAVTSSTGNNPGPNLTVVFNPTVSDPDGPTSALQCRWVFGDGSTEPAAANTFEPCAVTQHTYAQPGTYTVALTVTDGIDSTTVVRKLEVGRDDHRPPYGNGPGGGNNGPGGGGNNGPGHGHDGDPGDHGPGRGPDDHGRGDYGPGGGRHYGGDRLELVNDGHPSYAIRGSLEHGDFRIERDGGTIRRISGTGYFGDGSSVTFRLRVHHGRAFGIITVRDRDRVLDRFRMNGVRILHHGDTVAARTRYDGGDGRLSFVIEDRD